MTRELNITIKQWSAWAPGIDNLQAWQQWANNEKQLEDRPLPKPRIPAMLRRRLDTTGNIALHCTLQCLQDNQHLPTIFCSRHGELNRTIGMLENLAEQIALSPTAFSLSVHNTNSGIFSIARKDHSPSTAISAAENSLMMGLIEAVGQLTEGRHSEVLVVISDAPLPDPLSLFQESFAHPYGAAFLISQDENSGESFTLTPEQTAPEQASQLPQALLLVRQLLNKTRSFLISTPESHWQWRHHGE